MQKCERIGREVVGMTNMKSALVLIWLVPFSPTHQFSFSIVISKIPQHLRQNNEKLLFPTPLNNQEDFCLLLSKKKKKKQSLSTFVVNIPTVLSSLLHLHFTWLLKVLAGGGVHLSQLGEHLLARLVLQV